MAPPYDRDTRLEVDEDDSSGSESSDTTSNDGPRNPGGAVPGRRNSAVVSRVGYPQQPSGRGTSRGIAITPASALQGSGR